MVFLSDNMRPTPLWKDGVRHWLGLMFALLAFAFPMFWFIASKNALDWIVCVMFVLLLSGVGQQAPRVYYKDRLIRLCALLILMLVIGYIWQRFSIPKELLAGSPVRLIPAFCFFIVIAYGINAVPKVSPFLLLIIAGAMLLIHLSLVPADVWSSGWQGQRVDFGFQNAQHTGVIFATALLASLFFLPRVLSLPFRERVLALSLLLGFILLMIFGVIASHTRAVWLGLILSAVILSLMGGLALFTGRYSLRRSTLIRAATIGTGILLAGLMMLYFISGNTSQRLSEETINATTIEEAQLKTVPRSSSIGIRLGSWNAALEWIAERPVFGWGTVRKMIKQSPHFDEEFKSRFGHLHNSYLETLVKVGGAAFMCMIAIAFLVAWRAIMTWRQGKMPTDVFLFSCAFFPFWVTVNMFESYIGYASGFFLNAIIGGFVYSWYLRGQHD